MDKVSPTGKPLAGTAFLEMEGDLADQMVGGINRFLQRQLKASIDRRVRHWKRDFSSHSNYVQSIEKNRQCFSKIIGLTDQRPVVHLQIATDVSGRNASQAQLAQGRGHQIFAVRWTVIKGVEAEGLLLQPDRDPRADVGGPIKVEKGYSVFRVEERKSETYPYDDNSQRRARAYVKIDKARNGYVNYVRGLRQKYPVAIFEENLVRMHQLRKGDVVPQKASRGY